MIYINLYTGSFINSYLNQVVSFTFICQFFKLVKNCKSAIDCNKAMKKKYIKSSHYAKKNRKIYISDKIVWYF